jgi:hypothetical protein
MLMAPRRDAEELRRELFSYRFLIDVARRIARIARLVITIL